MENEEEIKVSGSILTKQPLNLINKIINNFLNGIEPND